MEPVIHAGGLAKIYATNGAAVRGPRRTIGLAALLRALLALQSLLILARGSVPAVTALHPVNAIAIFWVALTLVRRTAWRAIPSPSRNAVAADGNEL